MKVLRHIQYIQYGCGKQSVVYYILNNVIMPSFCSHTDQTYQNLGQLCQGNSVRRVHPYAYQQHMKMLKHCSYIQYEHGKQSVVVLSLKNIIVLSFHSSHTDPKLPNCANFAIVTV